MLNVCAIIGVRAMPLCDKMKYTLGTQKYTQNYLSQRREKFNLACFLSASLSRQPQNLLCPYDSQLRLYNFHNFERRKAHPECIPMGKENISRTFVSFCGSNIRNQSLGEVFIFLCPPDFRAA